MATILIVDDQAAVRTFTRVLLERNGYDVIEAESGAAVLRSWAEYGEKVDLVVTDLIMPDGVSGEALAEQLKTQKPGLPVVFTSGYGPRDRVSEQPLVEGQNFIPKPSTTELMLRTIRFSLSAR